MGRRVGRKVALGKQNCRRCRKGMNSASWGEIWLVGLDPTKGREQAGMRLALVVSVDIFNHGAAELVVVIPIRSRAKGIPLKVEVTPPDGSLTMTIFIECEDLRSISTSRLVRRLGKISTTVIDSVEDRLRVLLGL
jgi:mRNA interferase MazF